MTRNDYSAGAVKMSFWFMEFKKMIPLLAEGKTFEEIKGLSESENIFGAPTKARAKQIYSTVSNRIKCLDPSIYALFMDSDLATQKMIALAGALAYDTMFFDFVYEIVREKMILGVNELTDADIRIFFKNKQAQDEKVAGWQDYTLHRLGACYKTQLFEAGMIDGNQRAESRKILKPILDIACEHLLEEYGFGVMIKTLSGVR